MSIAIIVVATLVIVLVVWQTIQLQAIRKKVDAVPEDGNTVAMLRTVDERNSANAAMLESINIRLGAVEARIPHALARVGVVSYDAFGNITGNQSRSISLLNDLGVGIVITLLASRDETIFYTKEVRDGVGVQELSPEEQVAVDRAMGR